MPTQTDVIELTKQLIAIPSPSTHSNAAVSDYLRQILQGLDFEIEELAYDDQGERKVSLVARKGSGPGGFGFFAHSDTVPGDPGDWEPFTPTLQGDRLIGRGACDMKGPLAAVLAAAAQSASGEPVRPLYIIISADEEVGYGGARQVIAESKLLAENWPDYGVITEPTSLEPVHAHKGGIRVTVTARGRAAHTSTDQGVSANFLIAPFLAEMAELAELFRRDERFMNRDFAPPTNGFNMVLDDGGCKQNVTAARSVCTLGLRTMPDDHRDDALQHIADAAARHKLEIDWYVVEPFAVDPQTPIVQAACRAAGVSDAKTVPFGTEAAVYGDYSQLVVLGAGDIAQAHTVGEWIDVAQLQRSVQVYGRLIQDFCDADAAGRP